MRHRDKIALEKIVNKDFPELKENIQQILKTADVKITE